MSTPEDITRAAQSLVFTLKRLEQELSELGSLMKDHGRSLYEVLALDDWIEIFGIFAKISKQAKSISKLCLKIHFLVKSSRLNPLS
jgi:hypothetical protein